LGCGRQTTSILLQEVFFFNLKLKLFGSTSIAGGLLADTNYKRACRIYVGKCNLRHALFLSCDIVLLFPSAGKKKQKRNFFFCPEYFELCGARRGTLSLRSLPTFEKVGSKLLDLRQNLLRSLQNTGRLSASLTVQIPLDIPRELTAAPFQLP